ncbi:MAG: Uncharacterized protein G01um10147_59 [Microgenomates group bacterium Gr01-1014_7]|nr:MAG: Uncharacterized protein G01um10147_59 [Microgenomates group bacterium Gr01-1014_7]
MQHLSLLSILPNFFTLGLSIYLFRRYLPFKTSVFRSFLIISLLLIPLFYYSPNYFISFLPLISVGILALYKHFPNSLVLIAWAIFLFLGNLYSGEVIKYPFDIQHSQLIFNSPEVNYNLNRHQEDALFIPYKARLIVYSQLVYVYALLTNFFDFLNLKNLYDILLLANLYPISIGLYKIFTQKQELKSIFLVSFLITMLTSGIDRSPDKFQSLYLLTPVFIYLIILGAQSINKKLYFALWILSIFILISPKI